MRFKRILCGVVGATVLASSMFVSAADFPDIKGHWAETYVNAMVKKGYIKGYEDGTFKPNNTVSNTESLILLARMLGVDEAANKTTVDNALSEYSSSLSKYKNSYKNEISYLLYRGVIEKSDLDTYISDANKSKALLRYQCAMLLTKLLGADDDIIKGIETTKFPARIEVISQEPLIILDGGHNVDGVTALLNVLKDNNITGLTAVWASLSDKEPEKIIQMMTPYIDTLYTVQLYGARALTPQQLADMAKPYFKNVYTATSVESAIDAAMENPGSGLLVFGSLYLAADARNHLMNLK